MSEENKTESTEEQLPDASVMELADGSINPNFQNDSDNHKTVEHNGQQVVLIPDFKRRIEDPANKGKLLPAELVYVPCKERNTVEAIMKYMGDELTSSILWARLRGIFISWNKIASDNAANVFQEKIFLDLANNLKAIPVKLGELKDKLDKATKEMTKFTLALTKSGNFDFNTNQCKNPADQQRMNELFMEVQRLGQEVRAKSRKKETADEDDDN